MAIGGMISKYADIKQTNATAEEDIRNSNAAAFLDQTILGEQLLQLNEQAATEDLERTRQAMRERSKMAVALGESGMGAGATAAQLLTNITLQEGMDKALMKKNLRNKRQATSYDSMKVEANRQSRINQAKGSKMTNPFMNALQIGSAGMQGYGQGMQFTNTLTGR
jgi:hypothetical protein